jgi:hypothetical protein
MSAIDDYERRFRAAGLPLFIAGYTAREDVFTRAAPLLTLVFLAELLGALNLEWSLAANLGAVAGGLGIVLVALAAVNRARGQPWRARPRTIGPLELAAFVTVPALLPLVFGGQVTSALVTAAFNVVLLAVFALGFGFALLSILRWAATRVFGELAASLAALSRAIPLLLVFAIVLFVNTEMWQVLATAPWPLLGVLAALLVVLGTAFIVARLPREVRELERDVAAGGPPLARAERLNVALVMLVSQALQILVVTAAVAGFFAAFGALAIGPEVRESWLGERGSSLASLDLLGERVDVTEELLRVAGGVAALSGLYYAIALLTDATYREEFLSGLTHQMRATFAARAEYRALLAEPARGAPPPASASGASP